MQPASTCLQTFLSYLVFFQIARKLLNPVGLENPFNARFAVSQGLVLEAKAIRRKNV